MWTYNYDVYPADDELYHYGVKGMKWGVRRQRDRTTNYQKVSAKKTALDAARANKKAAKTNYKAAKRKAINDWSDRVDEIESRHEARGAAINKKYGQNKSTGGKNVRMNRTTKKAYEREVQDSWNKMIKDYEDPDRNYDVARKQAKAEYKAAKKQANSEVRTASREYNREVRKTNENYTRGKRAVDIFFGGTNTAYAVNDKMNTRNMTVSEARKSVRVDQAKVLVAGSVLITGAYSVASLMRELQ